MKKLEELKKGDVIRIEYGYGIEKVRVEGNDPIKKILLVNLYVIFSFIKDLEIISYDDYNLEQYELLNQ